MKGQRLLQRKFLNILFFISEFLICTCLLAKCKLWHSFSFTGLVMLLPRTSIFVQSMMFEFHGYFNFSLIAQWYTNLPWLDYQYWPTQFWRKSPQSLNLMVFAALKLRLVDVVSKYTEHNAHPVPRRCCTILLENGLPEV